MGKTIVAHGVIRLYHICLHTAGAIGETSGEWRKVNTDATLRGPLASHPNRYPFRAQMRVHDVRSRRPPSYFLINGTSLPIDGDAPGGGALTLDCDR
ncbi:hypothetical protein ACNJEE_21080, partial [Mycobacterium tuberculosis]